MPAFSISYNAHVSEYHDATIIILSVPCTLIPKEHLPLSPYLLLDYVI